MNNIPSDPEYRYKKIAYNYDLISGKVNQVSYQPGKPDAYYHRYEYDAENRLTQVYSGRDSIMLLLFPEREASYEYYAHGPLARTILGKLNVQGLDHVYTLQGWLKGINPAMGGSLTNGTDTTEAKPVAQDVFGFSLHYYKSDYKAIWFNPQASSVIGALGSNTAPLYNGNISAMAVNIPKLSATKVYNYKYDQLNRLVAMDMFNGLNPVAGTFTASINTEYRERISYDPNGNIASYQRNGDAARLTMDKLSYHYKPATNQLHKVYDSAADASGGTYANYLDLRTNQADSNYVYDAIGNLIKDVKDTITNITWNVYGKIESITQNANVIQYTYDAAGNRIIKATSTDTTYYVRDASGNVLSVYRKPASGQINQEEVHLYGSSRLGIVTRHLAPDSSFGLANSFGKIYSYKFTRGEKLFELSNHLGNVLVTLSDRVQQVKVTSDTVCYYLADIRSANDYYPFGMLMPGRKFNAGSFRYGFNGYEKDDEIKGSGNHLSFGDYGYDPRIGRRWQIDPIILHDISGYAVFNNNPNFFTDHDGESPISIFVKQVAKAGLKKAAKETVEAAIKNRLKAYMSKSWAKQLAGDALDAIDIATSQSWWEYAIEVIPIAGDAYGAYKLGDQGYAVYKITQKFESITNWAGKAAGQAFKKLGPNKLVGKGSDLVSKYTTDINNLANGLTEDDLAGAVKEIYGLKSGIKANGKPYQHLKEVTEHLGGLKNQIDDLTSKIKSGKFEGDALKAAQGILNDVSKQYNDINNTLNSAKKAAKKF